MLRKVIGVMVGLIVAMVVIMIAENINAAYYPMPENVTPGDREAMQAFIDTLPAMAFIILLVGYFVASFLCGIVIRLISRSNDSTPAYLAGLGLTTAGIVNFFSFEHPWWVIVVGLLIFLPATLLGFRFVKRRN